MTRRGAHNYGYRSRPAEKPEVETLKFTQVDDPRSSASVPRAVQEATKEAIEGGGGGGLQGDGSESPDFIDVNASGDVTAGAGGSDPAVLSGDGYLELPSIPDPSPVAGKVLLYLSQETGLPQAIFEGGAIARIALEFDEDWPQLNASPVFYDAWVLATGDHRITGLSAPPAADTEGPRPYGFAWATMHGGGESDQLPGPYPLLQSGEFGVGLRGFTNVDVPYILGEGGYPGTSFHESGFTGYLMRSIIRFRPGPDDAASAAVVTVKVSSVNFDENDPSDQFAADVCLVITPKSPPEGDVVAADWADLVGTLASDDVFDARSLVVDQVLTFNLNAAGLAYLAGASGEILYDFALCLSLDNDDSEPSVPDDAVADMGIIEVYFYGSLESGRSKMPTLVLTP